MGDSEDLRFKYFIAAGIGAMFGVIGALLFYYTGASVLAFPGILVGHILRLIFYSDKPFESVIFLSQYGNAIAWALVFLLGYHFYSIYRRLR